MYKENKGKDDLMVSMMTKKNGMNIDDIMLRYHLEYNHYPPIVATPTAIEICQQTIGRAVEAEMPEDSSIYSEDIEMPNGETRSVGQIVEDLHLGGFVMQEVEYACEER